MGAGGRVTREKRPCTVQTVRHFSCAPSERGLGRGGALSPKPRACSFLAAPWADSCGPLAHKRRPRLKRAPFMPGLNGTWLRVEIVIFWRGCWQCFEAQCSRERDSVLECVRQAWARRRFCRPDGVPRPKNMPHLAKAVSPMQACAVHLCHRSPRRCRVDRLARLQNP
jgi:hypothetical protein